MNVMRHFLAAFRTTATRFRASFHLSIIPKFFTLCRATHTHFRANAASIGVHIRTTQHKIFAGMANLLTVLQKANMLIMGVVATFLQAVRNGFDAKMVAFIAILDAVFNFGAAVMNSCLMVHKILLKTSELP
jgi:hypothetical protein